jgi:hypothetical protein
MQPRSIALVVCGLCGALSALGCDERSKPTAASATPAKALDLRGICVRTCERTTDCALEIARRATRGYEDKPDVKRAIADEERAARENVDACKKDCREQPIADSDRGQLAEADKCLAQPDCAGFVACLERLGTSSK